MRCFSILQFCNRGLHIRPNHELNPVVSWEMNASSSSAKLAFVYSAKRRNRRECISIQPIVEVGLLKGLLKW